MTTSFSSILHHNPPSESLSVCRMTQPSAGGRDVTCHWLNQPLTATLCHTTHRHHSVTPLAHVSLSALGRTATMPESSEHIKASSLNPSSLNPSTPTVAIWIQLV